MSSSKQFNTELAGLWSEFVPIDPEGVRKQRSDAVVDGQSVAPYALAAVSILQLAATVSREMDSFIKPFGLTLARMGVLLALFFGDGPISPSQLGFLMLVTRGNMTGLVQGLVDDGLVRRMPNPEDRRGQLLGLTAHGKNLVEEYLPHHFQALAQLFGGVTPEEAVQLARILQKVRKGMRTLAPAKRRRQARTGRES